MRVHSKFKLAAMVCAAALVPAVAAHAATLFQIGNFSQSAGAKKNIAWDAAAVGGGHLYSIDATGKAGDSIVSFKVLDPSSVYADQIFTANFHLDGVATKNKNNVTLTGGVYQQEGVNGSFSFITTLAGKKVNLLSGTFTDAWLRGPKGATTGGNFSPSTKAGTEFGDTDFSSDVLHINNAQGFGFSLTLEPTSAKFGVTGTPCNTIVGVCTGGATLNSFKANATGTFSAAVPEPATWALMIAGFSGAGAMLRRQRRFAAPAA